MYSEEELIPISALNHFLYCQRRCALVHIERVWLENVFTADGIVMHERVDRGGEGKAKGVRVVYSIDLKSLRLGLIGKADAVELHKESGKWKPFPVEYKLGRPKKGNYDRVQLCAQAMCLEEMYKVEIIEGALFYGKTRRREQVLFDKALRSETMSAAEELHELIALGLTPEPHYFKGCESCSFMSFCMPKISRKRSALVYLKEVTKG